MAHLHFKRTVYKSGGAAATARLEYITRQPAQVLSAADRQLRYVREGREDLLYERSRNLSVWAQDNPHNYFQAAERYERAGGVAFEEWKISLPQELSHRQNMDLMHDLVDAIAGDKLPITYAFHDPTTLDEQHQQPHLHLLISSRQNDTHARPAAQHFKRWNAQHPERGGAHKDPTFGHMGSVKAHRVLIADILNTHLEQAGHAVRMHPDTLESRQIARTPEPKLLPSESRQYREHGIISARMQEVLDICAERTQQLAREQNNARTYWEGRKTALDITRDLSMEAKLKRISEAREYVISHAPSRPTLAQLREEERVLEQSVAGLERHVQDLQHYGRREQRLEQRREPREWREELAAERVLAAGKTHGLPRDQQAEQMVAKLERTERLRDAAQQLRELAHTLGHDEPQQGAALRITLFEREEERERDQGRGW